ncbi:hypothetical protein Tco_0797800 [Tanacetum coccineum]
MIVMMMKTMMMMKALQLDQTRVGSTKEKNTDSGASGSAQPPTKDDEQSSKKPRKSDASASKQHPALPSTGWKITDTRDADVDSSMHRSDPESEQSEQSSNNTPMQDEGQLHHKPNNISPNDFPEPENNWANTYATTYQVPTENKLQRKTYDIGSFIKWFCRQTGKKKICKADLEGPAFNLVKAFHKNSVFLQYQMDECHKLLTNKFLEWEADVDSEHFDRDDNTGDDNEETKPDPEEILLTRFTL